MCGLDCTAQFSNHEFKFRTYTTQDGLVHNFTVKSRMDSKGFLWIITQNGLSRFDGFQFVNFQNKVNDSNSLPFNDLGDIAIDRKDRIWLAYDKGLCYYDQARHSFIKMKQVALSLCYDNVNNKLWFNNDDGLFNVDLESLTINASALQLKYPNRPLYLNIDSKQRLWISLARGAGFYVYDIRQHSYQYRTDPAWIRNVKEDNAGNIWICSWWTDLQRYNEKENGKNNGIFQLPRTSAIKFIFQDAVQSIPLTGPDIIWVAMHSSGVCLFDIQKNKFIQWWQYDPSLKSGIATDFNSSIYTDPTGIVWICTWKGLTKVNKQEQQFQSAELKYLRSDGFNLLTSIIDDPYNNNFAWIGVNGTGVCYYDKLQQKPVKWYYSTNEKGYDNNKDYNWIWIANGIRDRQNKLWFVNYGGFIKVDRGNVSKVHITIDGHAGFSSTARLLADGNIWISNNYGLVKFNPANEQYQFYKRLNNLDTLTRFYDVMDMNENEICCASDAGLLKFDKRTERFQSIPIAQADPIKKEWTTFFTLERIGNSIFAGSASGLLQYDLPAGQTKVLGTDQEIFQLQQHALLKDSMGNLWIYTLHGLFKYNPAAQEFKKFTSTDGIYNNSSDLVQLFYYHENIYIGYRMAYTRFNPGKVDVNNNTARPFINGLSVGNTLLQFPADSFVENTLSLSSNSNNLQFDYTAIDYTNSEKITFAYMLEGLDKDWIYAGTKRSVNYSNLKGGHYSFKLKACNSGGLWNDNYTRFKFYIRPPLWQRWWFWPLAALLFIGVIIFIARYRIKKIRRQEQQQTRVNKQMAELEMKALRSQMNPHFIFNSLNSIHKYIWENKEEDASEYLIKFSKLMRMTLDNSGSKEVPLSSEIEALSLYTELEHRRSNNKFDYRISISNVVNTEDINVPPLIFQPYIENAVWHGLLHKTGKGHLSINFDIKDGYLVCTIDDDGIGRERAAAIKEQKKVLQRSMAMAVTADRLKLIEKGDDKRTGVVITDKTDAQGNPSGTLVTVTLPLTA